jgi:hypothetical protein
MERMSNRHNATNASISTDEHRPRSIIAAQLNGGESNQKWKRR